MVTPATILNKLELLFKVNKVKSMLFIVAIALFFIHYDDIVNFITIENNFYMTSLRAFLFVLMIIFSMNVLNGLIDLILSRIKQRNKYLKNFKQSLNFYQSLPAKEKNLMRNALQRNENLLIMDKFEDDLLISLTQKGIIAAWQPANDRLEAIIHPEIWEELKTYRGLL